MNGTSHANAAVIAIDWGTSSLRGFLMSASGAILEERSSPHGIQNLAMPGIAGFEAAFAALCGAWLRGNPALPVVASGMVGSAQGWKEAPYAACPADASALAAQAVTVPTGLGGCMLIAPGVKQDAPGVMPDVMRGEEIQIAGALALYPELAHHARIVLPGTHSKWAVIAESRITSFATHMTGEVFALLSRHSILARLMPENAIPDVAAAQAAFAQGVAAAQQSGGGELLHQIFATRTLGLLGHLPHEVLRDYLSGLLIGHELTAGLRGAEGAKLVLIGDPGLCARYAEALALLGVSPAAILPNTAPEGLFRFARAAGLIRVEGDFR